MTPASQADGTRPLARDALLRRWCRERRPGDLERLVVAYQPLAHSLANRYARHPGREPDLEQAAYEGLVKALHRFDPERGTPFAAFAVPTMLGEVRRLLRDTTWSLRVPRPVQELSRNLRAVADRFQAGAGRLPTTRELAASVDRPEEDVVEALLAERASHTVTLAAPGGGDDGQVLEDRLGAEDPSLADAADRLDLRAALQVLPPEDREVLRLRFVEGRSHAEIGWELGCSRTGAGRRLDATLDELRDRLGA